MTEKRKTTFREPNSNKGMRYIAGVSLLGLATLSNEMVGGLEPEYLDMLAKDIHADHVPGEMRDFFQKARQGHRERMKLDDGSGSPHKIDPEKFLRHNPGVEDHDIAVDIARQFGWVLLGAETPEVASPNEGYRSLIYSHVARTFQVLAKLGTVSFQELNIDPGGKADRLWTRSSFWRVPTDQEGMADLIDEIDTVTAQAMTRGDTLQSRVLKACHFFAGSLALVRPLIAPNAS